MASRKVAKPVNRARVVDAHSEDLAGVERMIDQLSQAAERNAQTPRSQLVVDLAVGVNRMATNLGRRAFGCTITPTVADPAFAWSFVAVGDRQADITVLGVAQPGAAVEFF